MPTAKPTAATPPRPPRKKQNAVWNNVLRGSLGNLIEWYDFYIFSIFSVYFASSFFDKTNEASAILNSLGIFALGFLMRPLGSWFFGRYADRKGRKAALTLSVLTMASGSLLIVIAPTYGAIGIASTLILLFARLVQGFSVGGEYGTSATYLSEIATSNRRGFYSSFQYVTLISGQLTALIVQIILQRFLSPDELYAWGWRVPFAIGAVAGLAVLWLRRNMEESLAPDGEPSATTENQEKTPQLKAGSWRLLLKYPRSFFVVFGLTLGGTVAFYTYTTSMQNFMIQTSQIPKEKVSWINFFALLVFVLLQPVYGLLSDRIGRKPVLLFFGIGGTLLTIPVLSLLANTSNPAAAWALMMLMLLIVAGYTSINAVVKAELFPTRIRALGVGFPYALANALFGGTAPYLSAWFQQRGWAFGFYLYVTVCIGVSLLVYIFAFTNKKTTLLDEEKGSAYR